MAFGYHRLDIGVIDGALDGSTLAAAEIRTPVALPVVVVAADDAAGAAFSTGDEEPLARSQPTVEVVRVAGSGHRIHDMRAHREAFTGHLRRFLDTYAPGGASRSRAVMQRHRHGPAGGDTAYRWRRVSGAPAVTLLEERMPDYEIAVAGGGPAGLTAALFAARHGRSTVLLDPLGSGGAILNTERVEDFPGFPEGVPGFELGPRMQGQVIDAGGVLEMSEVTRIEPRGGDWSVVTDAGEVGASAVIVATGSRPRKLGVPREEAFEGRGLSTCASCDGPLYRGRVVAVCGDGDSALIETLELVRHDVRVVLIHPDEALAGQESYGRRVRESAHVEVKDRTMLEEILGDGQVDGIRVRDLVTGDASTLPVAGVFANVGRLPNTEMLEGVVALDERGCIPTDIWMRTEREGLFAAGDVRADAPGQAITAAGDGATAALAAHRYVADRARESPL